MLIFFENNHCPGSLWTQAFYPLQSVTINMKTSRAFTDCQQVWALHLGFNTLPMLSMAIFIHNWNKTFGIFLLLPKNYAIPFCLPPHSIPQYPKWTERFLKSFCLVWVLVFKIHFFILFPWHMETDASIAWPPSAWNANSLLKHIHLGFHLEQMHLLVCLKAVSKQMWLW